jgi:hypothetical protein
MKQSKIELDKLTEFKQIETASLVYFINGGLDFSAAAPDDSFSQSYDTSDANDNSFHHDKSSTSDVSREVDTSESKDSSAYSDHSSSYDESINGDRG